MLLSAAWPTVGAEPAQAAGSRRYWISEHHNMVKMACTAPEVLTAHNAAMTRHIRVGAAGITAPNHTSQAVLNAR